MTKIRYMYISLFLLFLGNGILITQLNIPIFLSLFLISMGHILFIRVGTMCRDVRKFLLVDVGIASILLLYYFMFREYNVGLVHNLIIALILLCGFKFIDQDLLIECKKNEMT